MINLFKFIIGSVLGSFVTLSSIRSSRNESVVFPASHCDHCNHQLRPWELIPVVSYLLLRGRCHQCRRLISPVTFIGESLGGFIVLTNPLSITGITENIFELLLLFVAERDYQNYLIPGWSFILIFFTVQSELFITHRFDLKILLIVTTLYGITILLDRRYQFIGNGDVDLIFILFLKLDLTLTLLIITISSFLATVKYLTHHTRRLIPYLPYLALTYFIIHLIFFNI